jgi:hypothetical protein
MFVTAIIFIPVGFLRVPHQMSLSFGATRCVRIATDSEHSAKTVLPS